MHLHRAGPGLKAHTLCYMTFNRAVLAAAAAVTVTTLTVTRLTLCYVTFTVLYCLQLLHCSTTLYLVELVGQQASSEWCLPLPFLCGHAAAGPCSWGVGAGECCAAVEHWP